MDALTELLAGMPVVVTPHAMWQAAERFAGFDTTKIEDEVRAALRDNRLSPDRKISGLSAGSHSDCVYVWGGPPHGHRWRVYAIKLVDNAVVVVTTMRRKEA